MRHRPNIGRAEMDVLRYVTDHHPLSVREVADHIAETKGHVRTTVLNVMERLRKKGYLKRERVEGVFKYSPSLPRHEMLQNLVRDFVDRALGGSIVPFVSYLAQEEKLSEDELRELKELVENMEAKRTDPSGR
jgi:predicted transcriptional regulator